MVLHAIPVQNGRPGVSKNYEPDARYRYRRDSYTKGEIDTLLDDKVDIDDVYTKAEADALLDLKADQSDTYTKAEVDALVEDAGGEKQVVTINNTSYVISESDKGKWLRFTSSNPVFVVWPIEAEFSPGNEVELFRVGDGPVTVFSEWAQDVRFNGKDDFRLNAKFSQVRAVNGDVNEWDCTYSGDVVFGVYQSPYYISDPGSDPSPIPWTPAEITTALWLDASDGATITESGGKVSQWNDKSGNSRHATQGTLANRPTTGLVTVNGLNAIDFDGADDWLVTSGYIPANTSAGDLCAFIVANSTGSADRALLSTRALANNGFTLRTNSTTQTAYFHAGATPTLTRTISAGANIFQFVRDALSVRLGENGSIGSASSLSNYTVSGQNLTIGADSGAGFSRFDGPVCEVVLLESLPTDSVREKVEGYLAWKWGLEGRLPALHPYKSAPPTV